MKQLMKSIFLSLFLVIGLFYFFEDQKLVELKITGYPEEVIFLPRKDKKRLEYLFRQLVWKDGLAYTLLGDKPMSFGGYLEPNWTFQSLVPHNFRMQLGWKTWLKYQHIFANNKYMLWVEDSPWLPNGKLIILGNRTEIESTIYRFANDFEQVLEKTPKIQDLLSDVERTPLLLKGLKKHEGLIGTLLGYGRDNSWLFHEKKSIGNGVFSNVWEEEIEREMLSELSFLTHLFDFNEDNAMLFYPSFAGNPHSDESENLKLNYRSIRNKILAFYNKKEFLEVTLSALKGNSSVQGLIVSYCH